jgi:alpha-L-arabinofuranosidase
MAVTSEMDHEAGVEDHRRTPLPPVAIADQVEYFNDAATTPMGRKRADNGHPEPYRVEYWQIGNELGDEEYQREVAAFCQPIPQHSEEK